MFTNAKKSGLGGKKKAPKVANSSEINTRTCEGKKVEGSLPRLAAGKCGVSGRKHNSGEVGLT